MLSKPLKMTGLCGPGKLHGEAVVFFLRHKTVASAECGRASPKGA